MRFSNYFSDEFKNIFEEQISEFKSEKTKSVYSSKVSELCDYSKKDFLDINNSDVISFFDAVKMRSNNSKCLWLRIFRSVAKNVDAIKDTSLTENFFIPEVIEQDIYVDPNKMPSLKSLDVLMAFLKDSEDEQLFLILSLLLETGLSINELISLKVGNVAIDTNGSVFLVFEPKVEEGIKRYIPLSKNTALLLQKEGSKGEITSKSSAIFLNRKYRTPLQLRTVEKNLKKACLDAGIESITLRNLKDIARAAMLKGGASVDSLSHQTGMTKTWFFRLDRLVKELDTAASSYNIIKVDSKNV